MFSICNFINECNEKGCGWGFPHERKPQKSILCNRINKDTMLIPFKEKEKQKKKRLMYYDDLTVPTTGIGWADTTALDTMQTLRYYDIPDTIR